MEDHARDLIPQVELLFDRFLDSYVFPLHERLLLQAHVVDSCVAFRALIQAPHHVPYPSPFLYLAVVMMSSVRGALLSGMLMS
jgi:hypothetical protein